MSTQKTTFFKTVEIRPHTFKNEWDVKFSHIDGERSPTKTYPNLLGFYHYPIDKKDIDAFEELRSCIAENHKREISRLQKSLDQLMELNPHDFI